MMCRYEYMKCISWFTKNDVHVFDPLKNDLWAKLLQGAVSLTGVIFNNFKYCLNFAIVTHVCIKKTMGFQLYFVNETIYIMYLLSMLLI